ncbi:MAG: F0F1 ATP synthase subunit A [Geminicoccaceae bacterium]|nr:F0F1 ATP synthase subunit A [Geminicoccaceae bacterium]
MAGPLEQFEVKPIMTMVFEPLGLNMSFTNSALFMAVGVGIAAWLFKRGLEGASLVPTRLQSICEMLYEFVRGMVLDNVGKEGLRYLPAIMTLFLFILLGNLIGMIPGTFTYTSHIVVTLFMGVCVIIAVTVIGLARHGTHFLSLFAPSGVPMFIYPLLIPIEIVSYLIRPFSLAMRLAVNMTAGHIMLKTFGGFVIAMGIFGILPFLVAVGLIGLEIIIACLQAYVFAVLSCIYLNDAINLH